MPRNSRGTRFVARDYPSQQLRELAEDRSSIAGWQASGLAHHWRQRGVGTALQPRIRPISLTKEIERHYPHIVELRVPLKGFGPKPNEMHAWSRLPRHQELRLCCSYR